MSATKDGDILAASGDGTANTTVGAYTLTAASQNNPIPQGWCGQFVRMRAVGGNMWYFFSKVAGNTVANLAAAADGAFGPTRGEYVPNGELINVLVPYSPDGIPVYFNRIGDAVGTVYITKASGQPLNNTDANGR